jgi:hypothetical protein
LLRIAAASQPFYIEKYHCKPLISSMLQIWPVASVFHQAMSFFKTKYFWETL